MTLNVVNFNHLSNTKHVFFNRISVAFWLSINMTNVKHQVLVCSYFHWKYKKNITTVISLNIFGKCHILRIIWQCSLIAYVTVHQYWNKQETLITSLRVGHHFKYFFWNLRKQHSFFSLLFLHNFTHHL